MNKQKCNPYCAPFVIYVILGVVSILANLIKENTLTVKATVVSANIISLLIFGTLFYWLCLNCHKTTAWVILLLPVIVFIILLMVSLGLLATIMQNSSNNTNQSS